MQDQTIRPTKKQRELLSFIESFITENGYSPSYREIMTGLNYTSVATVAQHVNSLIKRGHLVKRDRSARSLEVVKTTEAGGVKAALRSEETWLISKVDAMCKELEAAETPIRDKLDQLYVLVGSLKVLGLDQAASETIPRLTALETKNSNITN
jgi:SOS-response transcriptional repressor LexA